MMLKDFFTFTLRVIELSRDMKQCKDDITEILKRQSEQDKLLSELANAVRQCEVSLQYDRDLSSRDSRILVLELKDALKDLEHRLPPSLIPPPDRLL